GRLACESDRNRGGAQQPEDMLESHVETPPRGPIQYQASGPTRWRRRCPAVSLVFLRRQHRMPPLQGQVSSRARWPRRLISTEAAARQVRESDARSSFV